MQTTTINTGFDILKMYENKLIISIDKQLWEKVYSHYTEDQEMESNKEHLIQKYEESLQSGYGLTI